MARSLRIERPGAWYHVTARGNEQLAEFGVRAGGLDYRTVSWAIGRFAKRLAKESVS